MLVTVGTMAARAPKGGARPRAGTTGQPRSRPAAGRDRPPAAGRTSGSGRSAGTGRPGSAGRRPAGAAARGGRAGSSYGRVRGRKTARRSASANPVSVLLSWLTGAVGATWMLIAHTIGVAARAFGRSARDLDPAHRRDGIGLAALAAGVVAASVAWWHLPGAVGRLLSAVVLGAFGSEAWAVPVLCVLLSWRFLRHPGKNADTARMVIGWTALIIGILGLVNIANGTPRPHQGQAAAA